MWLYIKLVCVRFLCLQANVQNEQQSLFYKLQKKNCSICQWCTVTSWLLLVHTAEYSTSESSTTDLMMCYCSRAYQNSTVNGGAYFFGPPHIQRSPALQQINQAKVSKNKSLKSMDDRCTSGNNVGLFQSRWETNNSSSWQTTTAQQHMKSQFCKAFLAMVGSSGSIVDNDHRSTEVSTMFGGRLPA